MNYAFPAGAYAVSEPGNFSYWHDIPRTMIAGIESEYLLVERMQKNNFFYDQNLFNESIYWISNYHTWIYAYISFINKNLIMVVEGKKETVTTDSVLWAYFLFHSELNAMDVGTVQMSDLQDNEKAFLKTRVMWSLVNLASPMMFGVKSIPLSRDNDVYGNFALRQLYTSFGTDLSVNVYLKISSFNIAFAYHSYLNYEHYFPAIEAELIDYPVMFNGWGLYLTPRVMIGMQPKDMDFKTKSPEFFGLVGGRVDFAITRHFLPYIDISAKTDGWVAGNEFLEKNISFKTGLSMRF
jgi:hypothetical protein